MDGILGDDPKYKKTISTVSSRKIIDEPGRKVNFRNRFGAFAFILFNSNFSTV